MFILYKVTQTAQWGIFINRNTKYLKKKKTFIFYLLIQAQNHC